MKDNDLCPNCGSEIHFETLEMVDGHAGFFDAFCNNCGFQGRQWNELKFVTWQEFQDGEYIDMEEEK